MHRQNDSRPYRPRNSVGNHREEISVKTDPDPEAKEEPWNPDPYVEILRNSLESYENEHPHWRNEVLTSLIKWSLKSLKHYLEEDRDAHVTWSDPSIDLRYPVDWNWDSPRVGDAEDIAYSGLIFGKITKENTSDQNKMLDTLKEIMVCQLNTMALSSLTNGLWFEKKNDYYTPIVPIELCEELNAIKDADERRKVYEQFAHPYSIGAALIDYPAAARRAGTKVPKSVVKQLANISDLIDIKEIGHNVKIDGRKIKVSLLFHIHPLVADYDKKEAYHRITVGLFIPPQILGGEIIEINPSDWSRKKRGYLWAGMFQEVEKLSDILIPKAESQTSAIILVNAQLEIFVPSDSPEEKNAAIKKVTESLLRVGQLKKLNIETTPNSAKQSSPATEGKKPDYGFFVGIVGILIGVIIAALVWAGVVALSPTNIAILFSLIVLVWIWTFLNHATPHIRNDVRYVSVVVTSLLIGMVGIYATCSAYEKSTLQPGADLKPGRPVFVVQSGYLIPLPDRTFRIVLNWTNMGDHLLKNPRGLGVFENVKGDPPEKFVLSLNDIAEKGAERNIHIDGLMITDGTPPFYFTEFVKYTDPDTGIIYNDTFYFRSPAAISADRPTPLDDAFPDDIKLLENRYKEDFQAIK